MHHALEIQEILVNIFTSYLSWPERERLASLARLARTCRTFKEPALDMIWKELCDPSPLVRCLPDVSCYDSSSECYSLRRPLTSGEWDILQSYTSRVRFINVLIWNNGVRVSREFLLNPPTTKPLFPNLRRVYMEYKDATKPLLLLLFPSLTCLDVELIEKTDLEVSLMSLAKNSPNVAELSVIAHGYVENKTSRISLRFLCYFQNLQVVDCPQIPLDVNTLLDLSRMPALRSFSSKMYSTLPDQVPPSDSPLIFSTLDSFNLNSNHLKPVSYLISRIQLPVATHLSAHFRSCPSRHTLSTFFSTIQTAGNPHNFQFLELLQLSCCNPDSRLTLSFKDLQPCMAFCNLNYINILVDWNSVELTDGDLLRLASAWPHLQILLINEGGWNTPGGITPAGLLQLLDTCPSLHKISLAIDTRGYVDIPTSPDLAVPRRSPELNVLDSFIEPDAVPGMAAFFSYLFPCSFFILKYWNMMDFGRFHEYQSRWRYGRLWDDVHGRICAAIHREHVWGSNPCLHCWR